MMVCIFYSIFLHGLYYCGVCIYLFPSFLFFNFYSLSLSALLKKFIRNNYNNFTTLSLPVRWTVRCIMPDSPALWCLAYTNIYYLCRTVRCEGPIKFFLRRTVQRDVRVGFLITSDSPVHRCLARNCPASKFNRTGRVVQPLVLEIAIS